VCGGTATCQNGQCSCGSGSGIIYCPTRGTCTTPANCN
jgi:hypothetical protein